MIVAYAAHRGLSEAEAEADIVATLLRVAKRLGHKYKCGYHSAEDMEQHAILKSLEALGNYDVKRPLENFLYVHMNNRLKNFVRDNYYRSELPCKCCSAETAEPCKKWISWSATNAVKRALMRCSDPSAVPGRTESAESAYDRQDLLAKIDEELHPEFRGDYLKIRAGLPVTQERRDAVVEAVSAILQA